MFDWDAFLVRLHSHPADLHRLLPPCDAAAIQVDQNELGKLPGLLTEMLKRFDGAELFILGGPFWTFFRLSNNPPLPPLEWAEEWCVDEFTKEWRQNGSKRQKDWAVAMTNYGGLILLRADETVSEWDTSDSHWLFRNLQFSEWIERMMSEGETMMAE